MIDRFYELTQNFAEREHLAKKGNLKFLEDDNRPRLYCSEPSILARFAAEARQEAVKEWGNNVKVLMRGQIDNYSGMLPSLFRSPSSKIDTELLLKSELEFQKRIRSKLIPKRFKRQDLGALLQHYGFRTSWVDLVDNLWVAVWFATHELNSNYYSKVKSSKQRNRSGWIYILSPSAGIEEANYVDLRKAHHGLSLRPHTQHGWSLKGPTGKENDLNEYVIATIEFPITHKWNISGHMGSSKFLLPSVDLDDTLKKLNNSQINKWAKEIEAKFELPKYTLGALQLIKGET